MIWFISDEHIDHANIITFCNRPYKTTQEMMEALLDNHNDRVKKGDQVYHLGDMFWKTCPRDTALRYMKQLNGQHFYIRGNHEETMDAYPELREKFTWIRDLAKVKLPDSPGAFLCHYALRTWPGDAKGRWHLYGHSHGQLEGLGLSMDVGVDCNNYAPISLDEIRAKMKAKVKEKNAESIGEQVKEGSN